MGYRQRRPAQAKAAPRLVAGPPARASGSHHRARAQPGCRPGSPLGSCMGNRGERLRALLIAGPTASGKSALALTLAEKLGGTIINADSMQVYRDLRIITARPTPEEEARVPHLLYGEVDAAENYSAGRWYGDVRAAIAQAEAAGRLPILAGGTGLYFKVLTQGLAAIPPIPAGIRAAVRTRLDTEGPLQLHNELARRDPAAGARIKPQDRPRIVGALE